MSPLSLKMPLQPIAAAVLALSLSACTLGPDYQRPELPVAAEFKQAEGWKPASPADVLARGEWWRLYGDAELDALVGRLNVDNQNLAAAEAQFRQARALVRGARSQLFPILSGSAGVTRSAQGSGSSDTSGGSFGSGVSESYEAGLSASWEADIWGRLRRNLEANRASMQASAADLAAVRLSLQAELVQTYLQLRVIDEHQRLLDQTVAAYARSLRLTENQYRAGIVPKSDVTQAQTQLKSTQAQAIDLRWQRAQMEHAIAVLIGVAPSELDIAVREDIPALPGVPLAVPSQLLERRPDIAAAERQVMAANANIGVAEAAWYPDLTLSASGGYRNSSFSDLFSVPNRFWSLGPQLALTLLDFGSRRAELERAEASYDQTVANYRQTVLDSFREVEDYLVQLRVLEEEAVVQREALEAAQESLRLIENQYRAGTVDFLSVATVQTTALNNERTNLTLLGDRLTASVLLIAALGGGWDSAQLDQSPTAATSPDAP
ncbi:putative efflux pump outer membrane protein TtgC precursor [Stutzerimonas frequens]|uniref:efflux transporter outer membrane subunit n=1 Tax=Stutzerimonas frequens TaxID=2968969 RepID=UPI0007B891F5|nr:efflux transporter outer membrane subunit [Stutzerimonas frequens]KZX56715.1 RND transporter [Stutzerimonas frequens]QFU12544.1 putative efflux pump outer membrane protein TtgC precursor [Stutzerimonas frequens]|tara:strand:- start:4569 stop:6047 length:1479 start_codon:yes stop_codon:yes gene_type:complete